MDHTKTSDNREGFSNVVILNLPDDTYYLTVSPSKTFIRSRRKGLKGEIACRALESTMRAALVKSMEDWSANGAGKKIPLDAPDVVDDYHQLQLVGQFDL